MFDSRNCNIAKARLSAFLPRLLKKMALVGFIAVAALFYKGLVIDVEFQRVEVVSVTQIPGRDMSERLVVVDLGHRSFQIRTSDRLIVIRQGEIACVSKRHVLTRRWLRYRMELPGYCRNIL